MPFEQWPKGGKGEPGSHLRTPRVYQVCLENIKSLSVVEAVWIGGGRKVIVDEKWSNIVNKLGTLRHGQMPKKQLKVENGHLWRMRHEKLDIGVLLDWTVFHNKSCSTTWPIKLCMYQLWWK